MQGNMETEKGPNSNYCPSQWGLCAILCVFNIREGVNRKGKGLPIRITYIPIVLGLRTLLLVFGRPEPLNPELFKLRRATLS